MQKQTTVCLPIAYHAQHSPRNNPRTLSLKTTERSLVSCRSCLTLPLTGGEKRDSSREEETEKKCHVIRIFQDYVTSWINRYFLILCGSLCRDITQLSTGTVTRETWSVQMWPIWMWSTQPVSCLTVHRGTRGTESWALRYSSKSF